MSQQQPSEEELRAALEEEMRRLTPEDVIVQSAVTLVNLAGRKLGLAAAEGEAAKDLDQARTAIEAVRALLPLVPEEPRTPITEALSQLQMAYVKEAQGGGQSAEGQSAEPPSGGAEPPASQDQGAGEEAERAKARAKIWTPPGS